jgi:transposase
LRGKTCWQWVLLGTTAIYHVIADTRAAAVVADFLRGRRPEISIADDYGGQAGHGVGRRICLAHLLRDATYAIDGRNDVFAPGFRLVLLRAMAIGKRRAPLKDSTLAQYRVDLDCRLDKLLSRPKQDAGRRLDRAMRRDRANLFRLVASRFRLQ